MLSRLVIFILCLSTSYGSNFDYIHYVLQKEGNEIQIVNSNENGNDYWLAEVVYKNKINETGFAFIEIQTNPKFSDEDQAYYAGYIEGVVTSDLIYSQWNNVVKDFCKSEKSNCAKINQFLGKNTKWIKHNIKTFSNDSYWHNVKLFYTQMKGILDGHNSIASNQRLLKWNDIVWLNYLADIMDLNTAFDKSIPEETHCSVLIKILPDNKDIYFGHNTWTTYQSMLRLQKKYILNYRKSSNSTENIPGTKMVLTGFPGSISSQDDFYLISSGLATTETTNQIFNRSLWDNITPNSVLESVRSVVANRLASDGETWSQIFQLYNSGTYNNQWMILDYKRFKSGRAPMNGTFWVVEQIPSKIVANDLTDVLIEKGYWSSYNIPYYKEIYELSGYPEQYTKYGNWFSHENAPRPSIFKRDQTKVLDMESYMKLMRSNDYKNDPFARCECQPPYSATGAIAARNDLNPVNGSYQIKGQGHRPSGAIDAKITNSTLFLKLQFTAVSGPTTGTNGQLPVFSWSKSDFNQIPHLAQPNTWDFKPLAYKWQLT